MTNAIDPSMRRLGPKSGLHQDPPSVSPEAAKDTIEAKPASAKDGSAQVRKAPVVAPKAPGPGLREHVDGDSNGPKAMPLDMRLDALLMAATQSAPDEHRYAREDYLGESVLSREVAITKKVFEALGEDGVWLAARYATALTDNGGSCRGGLDAVERNEELCHGAPSLSLPALRVLAYGDRRWFLMGLRVLEARDPEACRRFVQDLVGPEATVGEQKAAADYISSMFYCPDPALGVRLLDLGEKTISAGHDTFCDIASSVWLNDRLPESQQARVTLIHGSHLLPDAGAAASLPGRKHSRRGGSHVESAAVAEWVRAYGFE